MDVSVFLKIKGSMADPTLLAYLFSKTVTIRNKLHAIGDQVRLFTYAFTDRTMLSALIIESALKTHLQIEQTLWRQCKRFKRPTSWKWRMGFCIRIR
jgi:hypothetical protein